MSPAADEGAKADAEAATESSRSERRFFMAAVLALELDRGGMYVGQGTQTAAAICFSTTRSTERGAAYFV